MGLWQHISSWWKKDDVAAATEDTRDNDQAERDQDAEDFEGRIFDMRSRAETLGGYADFERDSERPGNPTP
jgi:hypothetical protein